MTIAALDTFGRARLGPEYRLFVVAFFHELHCLYEIRSGILDRNDFSATPHHLCHCFDYLRQLMLCKAMDTLEEGDFMEKDFEQERVGSSLVCKDWEKVYSLLNDDNRAWLKWANS
ncbi:uncharacterized protein FOMMEDRAFT_136338 [Fomitiporia mediterranea MF3/22]|uniref:uncharacterized protein n=1 Tax=Fomitiporia mediterranea (strain MF3/22) TaxID=694068 RepID=UPI0004408FAF|nr:uncharacterized protein FOMMEDRAFT_136338 [Fomitiporia mediterranea MF3/22]EJC99620.1 hypothetical protein FOMMEDRAFT_136338 [Fomitiporia mediterranea MF3/22]